MRIRVSISQEYDTFNRRTIWILRTSAGYPLDGMILSVTSHNDAVKALREYADRRKQMGLPPIVNYLLLPKTVERTCQECGCIANVGVDCARWACPRCTLIQAV